MKMRITFGSALAILIVLMMVFFLQDSKNYEPDDVKVIAEGVTDNGLILSFRPPSELGYHCPGVTYTVRQNVINFEYIRSPINANTTVDIIAEKNDQGVLSVTFPFPKGKWVEGDSIELVDSTGKSMGQWKNSGN